VADFLQKENIATAAQSAPRLAGRTVLSELKLRPDPQNDADLAVPRIRAGNRSDAAFLDEAVQGHYLHRNIGLDAAERGTVSARKECF